VYQFCDHLTTLSVGNSDLDEFGLLSFAALFRCAHEGTTFGPTGGLVKPRSRLASGWGISPPAEIIRRVPHNSPPIWSISAQLSKVRVHGLVPSLRNFLRTQTRPRLPRCRGHFGVGGSRRRFRHECCPFPTAWTWRFRYCGASVARTGTSVLIRRPSRTNIAPHV